MTRWAANTDIFLLSPQRTPSTWQRRQISKNRLLLSSISLLHPSLWCAESVHWNTGWKHICITVLRFKPPCSSIITLWLTLHIIYHLEELWELLAWLRRTVPAGYSDKEETLDYSISSASPGKPALSTSIKNHLELPTIISAFHWRESGELADIQREWNIIVGEHIKTSSANIKLPLSSGG